MRHQVEQIALINPPFSALPMGLLVPRILPRSAMRIPNQLGFQTPSQKCLGAGRLIKWFNQSEGLNLTESNNNDDSGVIAFLPTDGSVHCNNCIVVVVVVPTSAHIRLHCACVHAVPKSIIGLRAALGRPTPTKYHRRDLGHLSYRVVIDSNLGDTDARTGLIEGSK